MQSDAPNVDAARDDRREVVTRTVRPTTRALMAHPVQNSSHNSIVEEFASPAPAQETDEHVRCPALLNLPASACRPPDLPDQEAES
mmetsp:Transcript_23635/g.62365  ORF Transcript_23635/g.62365 Transcript_23635/m.62365 type:complete len:86 (-) Transcript_23635:92-349(-)